MITGNEIRERYDDNGDNRYYITDGVVHMDVFNKYNVENSDVLYDEQFIEYIRPHKWRQVQKPGGVYITTRSNGDERPRHISLHRYIMSLTNGDISGKEIDHMNGNRFDNRLCNLRIVNHDLQMFNLPPTHRNKVGIRGISNNGLFNQPYKVNFNYHKRHIYVKQFETIEEAVYIRYLLEQHYYDDVALKRHMDVFAPYIDRLSNQKKEQLEQYISMVFDKYPKDTIETDKVLPGFLPGEEE